MKCRPDHVTRSLNSALLFQVWRSATGTLSPTAGRVLLGLSISSNFGPTLQLIVLEARLLSGC